MHKKLIIIALMIIQWSWGGQIKVKLPDSDNTKEINLDDEVIKRLEILKPRAPVSKKPMEAIGDEIDSNSTAGKDVMRLVGGYLSTTGVTDLGLVQTILTAADLKDQYEILSSTESITTPIKYRDYSVSIDALGILNIQREEKEVTLSASIQNVGENSYIRCEFSNGTHKVICTFLHDNTELMIEDLKGPKEFYAVMMSLGGDTKNNSIQLEVSTQVPQLSDSGFMSQTISAKGEITTYPVFQTICHVLKAVDQVKTNFEDCLDDSQFEDRINEFAKQLSEKLNSVNHPQVNCTILYNNK